MYQVKFTTAYKKIIYLVEKDVLTLTLVETGSHSDIFKK